MRNNAAGVEAYRRGTTRADLLSRFRRAEQTLDLSQVSRDRAAIVGSEASLLLYEVLVRAGLPQWSEMPGKVEVEEADIQAWRVPRTEITISRVLDGDRAGEFLFSPRTIERAREFYELVKDLEKQSTYPPGNYEGYITYPALGVPYEWADSLPDWAKASYLRTPVWKWISTLAGLVIGILAAFFLYRLGRRWDSHFQQTGGQWRIGKLLFSIGLIAIPIALQHALNNVVGIRFELLAIVSKILLGLAFVAGVFAVIALFDFIAETIISSRRLKLYGVNAQLIRVTSRILGIVGGLFLIFAATEYLGLSLAPVLAGVGIGGLAIALAARPTLENIIGGFTLFADKPIRVGDFCGFGNEEGWVEEIGLRSTRVRRRDDVLVSIPNADFSQMHLHNYARIRRRLYRTIIGLRYETTPEQLRYVLASLREMLIRHPKVSPDDLHVRFDGFGDYSLNLELYAYIRTRDWLTYRGIREDINLRIMDIVNEAGTAIAFPSQTNYFSRDTGLDTERGKVAESRVEDWRQRQELPFPEFDEEQQEGLEDTLDYPPEGSAKNRREAQERGD